MTSTKFFIVLKESNFVKRNLILSRYAVIPNFLEEYMRDTVMFIYLTCRSLGNMLIINLICRKMPNLETNLEH